MKVVCQVCGQPFEAAKVIFDEEEFASKKENTFTLIPIHSAVEGLACSEIRNAKTGEVVETMCSGSLRPPKISVH